jgi:sigma-B regulation protein RsbU (phosphoserine phosphatase)
MIQGDAHEHPSRDAVRDATLQHQLAARRERLRQALPATRDSAPLQELLDQVDAALLRMEAGTFGLCETCHDEIENDRLLADPLCRNCLDHLSVAEQRTLERDLDLAFQVQSGLLPKPGPAAPGWTMAYHYQPVGPVSGDYCDLIRMEDGSGMFLLGDVMGKGVAASMLTAHLHAIFRSLSTLTRPLDELVAKANRVFREGTLSSFFATLVCGRLGAGGDVEICNAGHCLPLHLHEGTVSQFDSTGLPLGLFGDAEYISSCRKLSLGDCLVIHSDGLSEATNRTGEEYGTERLTQVLRGLGALAPDRILAALLDDMGRFRNDAPVADDLTVMVISRES